MAITITTTPTGPCSLSGELIFGVTMDDLGTAPDEKKLGYRFTLGGTPITPWMSFRPKSTTNEEYIDATDTVRRALNTPFFSYGPAGTTNVAAAAGQLTLETREYEWDADACTTNIAAGPTASVYVANSRPTPVDEHRLGDTIDDILNNEILWTRPKYSYTTRDSYIRAYYYGNTSVTVKSFDKFGTELGSQTFTGTANGINNCPVGPRFLAFTSTDNVYRITVTRGSKTWTIFVRDCETPAYGEIYFLSRMGGWDTVPMERVVRIEAPREFTEIIKADSFTATQTQRRTEGGRTAANVKPLQLITLSREGADNEIQAEWLADFLNSPSHYIKIKSESGAYTAAKFVITNSSTNVWEDITVTGYFSYSRKAQRESA